MSPAPAGEEGEREADGGERDDDEDDDDLVDWDDEYAAETELVRIEMAMAADRPRDAPRITGFGPDGEPLDPDGRIADAQWQAFEQGVPRWWLVVPPVPELGDGDGEEQGEWCYADEALIAAALKAAEADDEDDEEGEDDGDGWEDDEECWEDEDGADPEESADETEGEETDETGAKGDGAGGDGPETDEPADASSPEAPPAAEPAPSPPPPPQQTARRWTYQIPPPNDGRCQPYYGRGW